MYYNVFYPAAPLSRYVDSYYILETDLFTPVGRTKIPPTGSCGLVFQYGDALKAYNSRHKGDDLPGTFLFGQMTGCSYLESSGLSKILGVHFQPAGFYSLFGVALSEFTDQGIDVEAFIGQKLRALSDKITEAKTPEEKIAEVDKFLLSRLRESKSHNLFVQGALELIKASNGNLTVTDLADKLHMTRRTLERNFTEVVGIYPKLYSSIIKFNYVLQYLKRNPQTSWMEVTFNCGYYDHSHFIRHFKSFYGESPSSYLKLVMDETSKKIQESCLKRVSF